MSQNKEIASLTGLRGVAALCVLTGHYFFFTMPLTPEQVDLVFPRIFGEIFNITDCGMTLFFVLSGFVIAYNYSRMDWKNRPIYSAWSFFQYRFARLYPGLFLFVIVVIWTRPDLFSLHSLKEHARIRDILTALTATQSWFYYLDANDKMVIAGDFFFSWSISTEFFLYITFAAMMILVSQFTNKRFGIESVAFYFFVAISSIILWDTHPYAFMTTEKYDRWLFEASPYYRMIEFGIGMSACLAYEFIEKRKSQSLSVPGFLSYISYIGLIILLAIWLGNLFHVMTPRNVTGRLIMAVGVFCLLSGSAFINKINLRLSSKPLVFIGTISYSLYLFHYLPPQFIAHRLLSPPFNGLTPFFVLMVFATNFFLSLIFSIAIGYGLYSLVEMPARSFLKKHIFGAFNINILGSILYRFNTQRQSVSGIAIPVMVEQSRVP